MGLQLSTEQRAVTSVSVTENYKTLTLQNTEYSVTIPEKTQQLFFHIRTLDFDLEYAFTSGGPYRKVPAGATREITKVFLEGKVLYLRCADAAGKVVDYEFWT